MWSYEEARELGRMVGQVNAFATDSSDELSIQELMEKYDTHQYSCTNKKTGCYQ